MLALVASLAPAGLAALGGGATPATAAGATTSTTTSGPGQRALYGVGAETLDLVDTSRGTPANGSAPARPSRTLSTWVLYPTLSAPGKPPQTNAAPANSAAPFPLIVFAHGLDSNGAVYDPLLQQWVAHGYVVVAPTFPLSNLVAPGGETAKDLANQPGDMSYVLTQVLALSAHPGDPLSGMIDRHRVAAVGHSLGAMTVLALTQNTCCFDPRFDAAVVMDGTETPFGSGHFFAAHKTMPLLVLHGTADTTIPFAAGKKIYADARDPKVFVSLLGAPHVSFPQLSVPPQKPPRWTHVDVASVLDFLAAELDHDPHALAALHAVGTTKGLARLEEQLHS